MTLRHAKKLKQGEHVFHIDTGEAGMITWPIETKGSMIFIETIDPLGKFHVWPYNRVERI